MDTERHQGTQIPAGDRICPQLGKMLPPDTTRLRGPHAARRRRRSASSRRRTRSPPMRRSPRARWPSRSAWTGRRNPSETEDGASGAPHRQAGRGDVEERSRERTFEAQGDRKRVQRDGQGRCLDAIEEQRCEAECVPDRETGAEGQAQHGRPLTRASTARTSHEKGSGNQITWRPDTTITATPVMLTVQT